MRSKGCALLMLLIVACAHEKRPEDTRTAVPSSPEILNEARPTSPPGPPYPGPASPPLNTFPPPYWPYVDGGYGQRIEVAPPSRPPVPVVPRPPGALELLDGGR